MMTVMIFHEVDDVDHWVRSPKRDEFFGPLGMTHRTFVDPNKSNRVGLVVEVSDMEALQSRARFRECGRSHEVRRRAPRERL